jgi:hypothetical protein
MDLKFRMLDDGGFVAGDCDSEMTSYAYPSSPHALVAKNHPKAVAEDMLGSERIEYRAVPAVKEYDRKNWLLICGASEQGQPSGNGADA